MFPEKAFTEADLDLIPILKSMFTALHTNPFGVFGYWWDLKLGVGLLWLTGVSTQGVVAVC